MDLQTKILEGAGGEQYSILVARGALTEGTLRETFRKIRTIVETHSARKFIVDLQYTTIIRKGELNIDEVVTDLENLSLKCCRIIFVCPMGTGHYGSLHEVSLRLSARGGSAAVFTDPKRAADWLALQGILK
jgi:hypothetical protein